MAVLVAVGLVVVCGGAGLAMVGKNVQKQMQDAAELQAVIKQFDDAGVPLPPGRTEIIWRSPGDTPDVTWGTTASAEDVFAVYRDFITDQGWALVEEKPGKPWTQLRAERGLHVLIVAVGDVEGGRRVKVALGWKDAEMVVGAPELLGNGLSADEVKVHLTRSTALGRCSDGASGEVTVKFTIGKDGSVTSAVAKASTMTAEVDRCIEDVVKGLDYPKPAGGGLVIATETIRFGDAAPPSSCTEGGKSYSGDDCVTVCCAPTGPGVGMADTTFIWTRRGACKPTSIDDPQLGHLGEIPYKVFDDKLCADSPPPSWGAP